MGEGNATSSIKTGRNDGTEKSGKSPRAASSGIGGRGRSGGQTEKTERVGLSSVKEPAAIKIDLPGDEPEEPKKKGRGRPKGSTAKKKANSKKSSSQGMDDMQLKMLLMTVSNIIASRDGMDMWALTPQELDQLVPAINDVLSLHEGIGEMNSQYAPYITLVTVTFIIFIPKYLQFKELNKNKPKKVKHHANVQSVRPTRETGGSQPHPQAGTPGETGRQTDRRPASNRQGFGGQLHELFPVLGQ